MLQVRSLTMPNSPYPYLAGYAGAQAAREFTPEMAQYAHAMQVQQMAEQLRQQRMRGQGVVTDMDALNTVPTDDTYVGAPGDVQTAYGRPMPPMPRPKPRLLSPGDMA